MLIVIVHKRGQIDRPVGVFKNINHEIMSLTRSHIALHKAQDGQMAKLLMSVYIWTWFQSA